MENYASKKVSRELSIARRENRLTSKDTNNGSRSTQYCKRLGCSTRLDTKEGNQIGNSEKGKNSKPSFRASSSKTVVGSSYRSFSNANDLKSSSKYPQEEIDLCQSSNMQNRTDCEVLGTSASSSVVQVQNVERGLLDGISSMEQEVLSSATTSNTTSRNQITPCLDVKDQVASIGPSIKRNFSSQTSVGTSKGSVLLGPDTGSHNRSLKNFRCTSLSDVLPSGCTSSISAPAPAPRGTDSTKRRGLLSDGESSSRRGKSTSGSSTRGSSSSQNLSISYSERSISQQAVERTRNRSLRNSDNKFDNSRVTSSAATSVRTRRMAGGTTRSQMLEHGNRNCVSTQPVVVARSPQRELVINDSAPSSSSHSFTVEVPLSSRGLYLGQPRSVNEAPHNRRRDRREENNSITFQDLSIDADDLQRVSMDGIAEVLLALERIEQDEELSYEQLLALETNLLLGGLGFLDQHRDMRLDIDNMSYEELLALEDRMGTVSTALTEEALTKCLTRSLYQPASLFSDIGDDDTKCSICQEEYCLGEEVGKLGCEHRYHVECIQQWLRMKNWCPICKVSASPSSPNNA